ncbi:MAG: RNA polymerase sigma factor [Desulfohalobiaceae bacterium]
MQTKACEPGQLEFTSFYKQMAPRIYTYLLRLCHKQHLAEELLQETFLAIYKSMHTFDPKQASAKTWAFAIATNKFRDQQRKNWEKEISSELMDLHACHKPSPETLASLNQDAQRLQRAVLALPPKLRATLLLVRFEGLKYREAADVLGVSLGTVRMQLHRSLAILKKNLAGAEDE